MSESWRTPIRCYVSTAGRNKVADWYAKLSPQEKAYTDTFLRSMRKLEFRSWVMPYYRANLKGGDGIGELRWQVENKQHRLLGFFQEGFWYALIGCTHKQQVYNPPECIETAKKRKKEIERKEAKSVEYAL